MDADIVEIFTDGACRGNPGPGGWAALLRFGVEEKTISGAEPLTTNNRMELTAPLEALKLLKRPCRVVVTTDSQYVKQGMTTWLAGWKRKNWRNSKREPVKNVDLWQALDQVAAEHRVEWCWVRGHAGHAENERVDQLACAAIDVLLQEKK